MPPPTPLHASERKLGWFMLTMIPLAVAVMLLSFGDGGMSRISGFLRNWVPQQWDAILRVSWPGLSRENFIALLMVSLLVGIILLVPWHLHHLLGRRRGLSSVALWFWTGIYGLAPVGVGIFYLYLAIEDRVPWTAHLLPFFVLTLGEIAVGLAIAVLGFRAWRRRRREDRAALAAGPTADPALPAANPALPD